MTARQACLQSVDWPSVGRIHVDIQPTFPRYLARISCPTLVLHGEHSPLLAGATVRRMVQEVLEDARAVEIPVAGHALMLDNPAAFRAALLAFLGSL